LQKNSVCNILVTEVYAHHNQVSRTTTQRKCKKKSSLSAATPIVIHTVAHQLISNRCI